MAQFPRLPEALLPTSPVSVPPDVLPAPLPLDVACCNPQMTAVLLTRGILLSGVQAGGQRCKLRSILPFIVGIEEKNQRVVRTDNRIPFRDQALTAPPHG